MQNKLKEGESLAESQEKRNYEVLKEHKKGLIVASYGTYLTFVPYRLVDNYMYVHFHERCGAEDMQLVRRMRQLGRDRRGEEPLQCIQAWREKRIKQERHSEQ